MSIDDYALVVTGMIARTPHRIGHLEAASIPMVVVTACWMLFDYAHLTTRITPC